MKADVQVREYRQLPDIKSNDTNISLFDSMNQVGDCHSQIHEVHNEGMFILDSNVNVDAFTGAPNEEVIQPLPVNEESKIVENNSYIITHEIHAQFIIPVFPYHLFMDSTLHPTFAWFLMLDKILRLEF